MKDLGYGENYRYAHNETHAFAAGERYLPDGMKAQDFYQPVERGLEIKISEKLRQLRALNQQADQEQDRGQDRGSRQGWVS
jgi:putative ATPase